MRSRVTLAMIDAAAMQKLLRSPPTILCLRKFETWNEAAVHQHVARSETQGGQRAAARRHGGPIDIEAIDFVDLGDADADCYRALADGREEFLALLVRQLF